MATTTLSTETTKIELSLFKKAVPTGTNLLSFKEVNKVACKLGYVIHPNLCCKEVLAWVMEQRVDYNSTFYKEWNDVMSKSRFELLIDQLIHYASTYGTGFTAEPYIPNDGATPPSFKDLIVISPITEEELVEKCTTMLYSGIALKEDTLKNLLLILDTYDAEIDVAKVRNKEAKMYLYKSLNVLPKDTEDMVRYLVFLYTDGTMVIKDRKTIKTISEHTLNVSDLIENFGIEKLSSVFYRYKALFLAMRKSNRKNKAVINKLRKLAVKNHKPYQEGYFEQILKNPNELLPKLPEMLEKLNNYKKVLLLQTISVRYVQPSVRPFLVRNQKLYMKEGRPPYMEVYSLIYDMIYASLIESLKKKACKVKVSDVMNLTLPTSEKSFIGNLPLGTSFTIGNQNAIVGINWKGEDGAKDIDLKYIDIEGKQVGWNASYYNDNASIIYSGDMTTANPEATELLYSANGFTPAVIKVNLYSGEVGAKFKMFLAKEQINNMSRGYMVDPNNILFQCELSLESKEMILGVLTDNKFVVANFRTSEKMVAGDSITNKYAQYSLETSECYLSLNRVLSDAGFTITNENYEIDLSQPDKSTLINLLV